MKIKELTVTKGNSKTIKSPEGNYDKHEASITLVVSASEDEKFSASEVISQVKRLVEETLSDDPKWIQEKQNFEKCKNCGASGHSETGCSYNKDAFKKGE